jgi:hypothetical protein
MSGPLKKVSSDQLIITYLQAHIGQWVAHRTLRDLTGNDDVPKALRDLRNQRGYPIQFDGRANSRLLPAHMNEPRGDGRSVSPSQRVRILERDGGRCQLCGVAAGETASDGQPARLEVDHIVPRDEGGPTTDENLRTLCHVHNHDRNEGQRRRHVGPIPAIRQERLL